MSDAEKKYWLDEPKNVDKIVRVLYVACAFFLCADFFNYKHPHFDVEGWWGFFGLYALIGIVSLVLVSKAIGVVLVRGEDYYDE